MSDKRRDIKTHTGHPLTVKESKFIDNYVESGNGRQSVIKAGYTVDPKEASRIARQLWNKLHINEEISYRLKQHRSESIANRQEILEYFTKVMRGQETDQFGLDAPLSERTKAAVELAKRTMDIEDKISGKNANAVTLRIVRD